MNKIIVFLTALLLVAGCKNEDWTPYAHTIGKFYILVENEKGEDLLDENVEGNILSEKTQYIFDGDTLGIAWQHPYHIYDYKGFAYIKEKGFALGDDEYKRLCVIATDFTWWDHFSDPMDFKIVIGSDEFSFAIFTKNNSNVLIMPNGTQKYVPDGGFTLILTYLEDGSISVNAVDGYRLYHNLPDAK